MELSVVIPVSGRRELLCRCLRSLNSAAEVAYEVCAVDDGSGLDEQGIRKEADVSFPLIWRSFDTPRGRSAARNEGIRSTTGGIIVFIDSDMEAGEGFLEAHRTGHRDHPHTAVIGRIIWPDTGGFIRYIGSRGVAKLTADDPVPPWYFVTGNSSVTREDLPSENPFDETLPGWGGEDLDLGMKLSRCGITFKHVPDAVSFHHFEGTLRDHVERTFRYGASALPVLARRYPEIMNATGLNHLDSVFWRMLIHGCIFRPAVLIAGLCDPLPLPFALYDYLTFAAYARGWMKGTSP